MSSSSVESHGLLIKITLHFYYTARLQRIGVRLSYLNTLIFMGIGLISATSAPNRVGSLGTMVLSNAVPAEIKPIPVHTCSFDIYISPKKEHSSNKAAYQDNTKEGFINCLKLALNNDPGSYQDK